MAASSLSHRTMLAQRERQVSGRKCECVLGLPERLGSYQTVKRRYYRCIEAGPLVQIFQALAKEADLEWLQIDATVIRAHKHEAGAPHKRGALHPRDWAAPRAATAPSCMR